MSKFATEESSAGQFYALTNSKGIEWSVSILGAISM